ncbi:hypothetical protein IMSAGC019_03224 [Lachnospiraceae bacterium]|nr:hypothetical protein IMSAGC019_03224 [Lachnospiraceae bacterium]
MTGKKNRGRTVDAPFFRTFSPPQAGGKRSVGTRSHRMKFCVQGGLGALPSTSKQNGNPGRDFPLCGRCVLTPALLAKVIPERDNLLFLEKEQSR